MTAGLQLFNSSGVLLVSTDMLTHFCRKTGTGTTVANTAGGAAPSMAQVALPAGYHKPIIAISCGSTMSYAGMFGGNAYYWCSGAIGTSFNYYIFDTLEGVSTSHIGMETYDTAGNITFSTKYRPLAILGLNPGVTTYSGKTVAAALPAWSSFEFVGPLACWDTGFGVPWSDPESSGPCNDLRYNHKVTVRGAFIDSGGTRINPSNITYEDVQISAGDSTNYTYPAAAWDHPAMLMAVDVTGIAIGSTFF